MVAEYPGNVDLRQDQPHTARIYDYFLGGKQYYEADRIAADEIEKAIPNVRVAARVNREFMTRATRFAAQQGIRQFLDVGTGIPTEPNLHQIAQQASADAHVVYVDNDPIVLAHARALLVGTPEGRTEYIQADITEPATILTAPELRDVLDFDEPIALSLIALLHFVPGDRTYDIVNALMAPLAPGSLLTMTYFTADFDPEGVAETVSAYGAGGISIVPRDRAGVAQFFDGMTVVDPGVVPIHRWRYDGTEPAEWLDPQVPGYAAVGQK